MVTDGQVSELRRWLAKGKSLAASARMASMDKKTARSYRDDERLPSQRKTSRNYRTRTDPFADVWADVEQLLLAEPRLKAKTLFDDLQRQHPGKFEDSTRRTFERRFNEERIALGRLPETRLDTDDTQQGIRVSKCSTINVRANTYSVPSRLIGTKVNVRISAETITVTRGGNLIQTMPRLVGKQAASINYRHVIDSLVRKPGAFTDYRYREEMFPSSHFRFAYDALKSGHSDAVADKMYLQILKLAADESQHAVEDALRQILSSGAAIVLDDLREHVAAADSIVMLQRM